MTETNRETQSRRVPRPASRKRSVPDTLPGIDPADGPIGRSTPGERRDRRRTLAMVVVLVGALLALGIPAYGTYMVLLRPQVDVAPGQAVQVEIPEGSGTRAIADVLAGVGVIDNASMFRVRARLEGIDGELKPGVYDLTTGMPHADLVKRLLAGPPVAYASVTIPEGFTVDQIAERLEADAGIPAAEFREVARNGAKTYAGDYPFLTDVENGSLEGYLFPKTYRIAEGSAAGDVVEMMLDQFASEISGLDLAFARSRGLTQHDVVIIASMIEREARVADERPLVSSVIYNRLGRDMKLEIDATIEYILPGNRPRLLNRHLRIDSPYNTYMYAGLPVGPISNPGLSSLEAAAHPADTQYLYYVLTSKDGTHTFTTTLEEFLKAKEKSREVVP